MSITAASVRHLPANGYRRLRWRNGLGWTREIHAASVSDDGGDDWDWRLSIAEIEADGPYSAFPGVEREQVLLSGEGLVLDFGQGGERLLEPPHGRQRFGGGDALLARLHAGRVEVFNLMWRPAKVAAQLWHRPLVDSMLLFVDPGSTWAVHVMAGQAMLDGGRVLPLLERGDSALLEAREGRERHLLEGSGDLLLVRVEPVAQ
ncbi:HutD/Ves family protein [Luteimonas arsenica]|uniref:HutD/Ves family protein n=1 Tax=Luteimonas arsenica TaxID=1586242 RepID=UPI001055D4F1|nr:HutD family protein [Luteimonas arsenica]